MDYKQEQEMEIEALQAILMDEFAESQDGGLETEYQCYQITISPEFDDEDETTIPVKLALIFAHTTNYPDEIPLLNVRSLRGVKPDDIKELKEKLHSEAEENLGMSMMFTLAQSAKEWLSQKYAQNVVSLDDQDEVAEVDEVVEPHGEAVTIETFIAWRERFEAELALERAKLMPESALMGAKEKRPTGRAWFERAMKGGKPVIESSEEEEEEEVDFDEDYDDGDIDEDDMLEHYLSQKS